MFYLESDFESFISLIFALTPLSEGSVQHGQRLTALMDSHPAWFSPGRSRLPPRSVLDGRHWRPAPPLRDSVAGRKCSMPPASHSPGGCRPPVGVVPRWLLVRGCRMRTLTCSVFKERRESERSAAHSFSANYAALFRGRLIYPFIFIGIGKPDFTPPFSEVFEVCASVYKQTSVICAISRQFPPVSNQCKPVRPLCDPGR